MGFGTHFFDSGAFTLEKQARKWAKATGRSKWDYFTTSDARSFLDGYASFVHDHQVGLDFYANVDVIGNPELTWANQKYLESKGLRPVPVVHCGTDVKWLRHYIAAGYDFIALGGLVGRKNRRGWLDTCFEEVCRDGLPCVKLHGFGVSSFSDMRDYPWWSVDSTTWIQVGRFGNVFIPRMIRGEWDFASNPLLMTLSSMGKGDRVGDDHIITCSNAVRSLVKRWFDHIRVPLDCACVDVGGYRYRQVANIRYLHEFGKNQPKWPWVWRRRIKGFGL